MAFSSVEGITRLVDIPRVHVGGLIVAIRVLISKKSLFRSMLRAAQKILSAILIANAWHARSDAASSLVVAVGIIGSMAGWRLLDPIAAAIVGFMVARMGWIFGSRALQDLSDRALDQAETVELRALPMNMPGVHHVPELGTRKMGNLKIVDAHIVGGPLIFVSEGHYSTESSRVRLMTSASGRCVDSRRS
jgi:cation diffusion facilitator family transporter